MAFENHTRPPAQERHVCLRGIDILSVNENAAGNFAAFNKIVHTIKRLQTGGFSASGRADESCDFLFRDFHRKALERMKISVI